MPGLGKTEKVSYTGTGSFADVLIADVLDFAKTLIYIKEKNVAHGDYKILASPSRDEDEWYEIKPATVIYQNTVEVQTVTDAWARVKVQLKDNDGASPWAEFDVWIVRKPR